MENEDQLQFENEKLKVWITTSPRNLGEDHIVIDLSTRKASPATLLPQNRSGEFMVIETKEPKNRPLPSIPID